MRNKRRNQEAGIALVLALLALMLLTFLGLGLAATTSTELQIANNYRWSQQAFYNAEAGLAVAQKAIESLEDFSAILPEFRADTEWDGTVLQDHADDGVDERDYENSSCDLRGGGVGYGRVLNTGGVTYRDVSTVNLGGFERRLHGAFTVWVRRVVELQGANADPVSYTGLYQEKQNADGTAANDSIVITVEGVAPFVSRAVGTIAEQHQAVRTIEASFDQKPLVSLCDFMDPEGAGFAKCKPLENGPGDGDSSIL